MSKKMDTKKEHGSVKISEDVISIIAGIAATEIKGVHGMSGGFTGELSEMLGMKNLSKGVKVEFDNSSVIVNSYIIIDYGENLVEVSKKVQENIKKSIETMTGLSVKKVNVNVQGVKVEKSKKEEEVNTN